MKLLNDPFLNQITNLFSLKAFRPDPFDMTAPLSVRFHNQPILGVCVYPGAIKFAQITFGSSLSVKEIGIMSRKTGDDKELVQLINAANKETGCRYALVGYNYGFNALKSFSIKRSDNLWAQLKDNPAMVLGDDFENGHQYSLEHHPNRDVSIVFSYDTNYSAHLEKVFDHSEVEIIRLQHTIGSLFSEICRKFNGLMDYPLIIMSGSSVFYLDVEGSSDREWMLLRNRSENPVNSSLEAKRQLNFVEQILPREGNVLFYTDELNDADHWEDRIKEMRPELNLVSALPKTQNTQFDIFHTLAGN